MLYPENILEVCALKPDFVGYIFYAGSKRYVGDTPDPAIFRIPERETAKVGVFVNEELSVVKKSCELYHLDLVQLHGNESPQYCQSLNKAGISVIKALNPYNIHGGRSLDEYKGAVQYFLFDTPGKEFGGTGRKFDWDLLSGLSTPQPFLLSGGIGPADAMAIVELDLPGLIGIDVNSKFESYPGMKNKILLEDFIKEIRA